MARGECKLHVLSDDHWRAQMCTFSAPLSAAAAYWKEWGDGVGWARGVRPASLKGSLKVTMKRHEYSVTAVNAV